ncbi:probable inactive tRNA-specific adenosine deaminase-like protein 3 [Carassius gibelio]|uniref:probable inactive tRNA-specific adenosine deaminase-like protein 3 n=1 Tax=Carassius gibelio TaxID=101364 RepID=UPI002278D9FF|nr:probable inactive tRNA-specific adenosine deaminase-like protein 3 [Carassius gibelio]
MSALRGHLFTADQKAKMQEYMTAAVEAAGSGEEMGMDAVGAVIVDPESEQIVVVGHDFKRGSHPLHHAVMVCIDLVACGQGEGAYNYEKYLACRFSSPLGMPAMPKKPDSLISASDMTFPSPKSRV